MSKRKILLLATALCLVAILAVGGTLAYFIDSDNVNNVFTMGYVHIVLDEGKVITKEDPNGNQIYDKTDVADRTDKEQEYFVFPGDVVTKDPIIHVQSTSQAAWVAAKIVVKGDLITLLNGSTTTHIDIRKLVKNMDGKDVPFVDGGEAGKTATYVESWNGLPVHQTATACLYQDADPANNTWTIYIFMTEPQKAGNAITLFDTINIPATWENAEAEKFNETEIDISAYAVQWENFDTVYDAMTVAFPDAFAF